MLEQIDDTIAAIATPEGAGAIGVVRVSGPASPEVARAALRGWPEAPESHRLYLCRLVGDDAGVVDQVLACLMRAPRSYTGEDVLEVHAHGGTANLRRVLAAMVARGARLAEPGEFTRRAYTHGRMDLLRAEAVAEVIAARSERAARLAQQALAGAVSEAVRTLRAEALVLLAEVEARVDFPEEDLDYMPMADLAARCTAAAARCAEAAAGFGAYRVVRDGAAVAIVGPPNAGKSSLLNVLYGGERALVSPTPGTTRDYLDVELCWDGVPVRLIDTAGDREPVEDLERRGVELGRERARAADLRLVVLDASAATSADAQRMAARWPEPCLVVWNKTDLAPAPDGGLAVSAARASGLERLRAAVVERLGIAGLAAGDVVATSDRQREGFASAASAFGRAADGARGGAVPEVLAVELRDAGRSLAGLLGEGLGEDVLAQVFARFCIGK